MSGDPGAPFDVVIAERGPAVVLTVTGEVDLNTAPRLREALEEAVAAHPSLLVVDLTDVDFLGSPGLAALIAAHDRAQPRTRLRVVASSTTPVLRPIRLTGLEELLNVHPTLDHALSES